MRKSIDNFTKDQLNKVMHGRKGLAIKFDSYLLSLELSDTAKLLYAGIFYLVPQKVRKSFHKHNQTVRCTKSKTEIHETLNISRAQFYRAINELEALNLITTHARANNVTYYELHHNLDATQPGQYDAFITTDILQNKYVTTKQNKQKTYSANARIVLGRLFKLSQAKAVRKIETTAKEISSSFSMKKSTVYYLLKQFAAHGNLESDKVESCVYSLVLMDHYMREERMRNAIMIERKNKLVAELNREMTPDEFNAIDSLYNMIP